MTRIMPRRSRRTLLKGLVVTLPAAWSRPVVEAVVLPAHAQTSPGACSAEAGCYAFLAASTLTFSFPWPGGTGPFVVNVFSNADCSEEPVNPLPRTIVVAADAAAAAALLTCPGGLVAELSTDPALSGCGFFGCELVP